MTYWPRYLWLGFPHALGLNPQTFMYGVGVIEIVAGLGGLLLPPRSHCGACSTSPRGDGGPFIDRSARPWMSS
jgi:hypothetical protein